MIAPPADPMSHPPRLPAGEPESIFTAARILRDGGIVVVPTDTVYGLAASIFQPAAIVRLFAVKHRAPEARVPVLLATAADLPLVVKDIPRAAWQLINRFWPGPLTLVLPARQSVPASIRGGGGTLAVRVPAARSCLALLQSLGEPIVGTSANLSGSPPALTAQEAIDQLGPGVDAILVDDAAVKGGASSTVVELADGPLIVHRAGAVSVDDIRKAAGLSSRSSHLQLTRPGET
jgi:L-threonylcarbamoyladenylate synthase